MRSASIWRSHFVFLRCRLAQLRRACAGGNSSCANQHLPRRREQWRYRKCRLSKRGLCVNEGRETAFRLPSVQGRRRQAFGIGLVWLAWLIAVLLTVVIGLAAGTYVWRLGWYEPSGLWPLFTWDYSYYAHIARTGYPSGRAGAEYAFISALAAAAAFGGTALGGRRGSCTRLCLERRGVLWRGRGNPARTAAHRSCAGLLAGVVCALACIS